MNIDNFHPLILNVGLVRMNANWNWKNVCSPFARLYCVTEGDAIVAVNDRTYQLLPGHLYLIPPFARHSYSCSGRFTHYYIHIYTEGIIGSEIYEEYDLPFEVECEEGDEQLFARLVRNNPSMALSQSNPQTYDNTYTLARFIAFNKGRSESLKMESRGIVLQLFARFVAKATMRSFTRDERLLRATNYIHCHLADPLTIEQLASEASLSPEHFIRIFSHHVGMTPMFYITCKRMEQAQLLLVTTDRMISDIAFSLGYSDTSYFVRVFKRITGVTPGMYRRNSCSR